jgi:hypothetical protein
MQSARTSVQPVDHDNTSPHQITVIGMKYACFSVFGNCENPLPGRAFEDAEREADDWNATSRIDKNPFNSNQQWLNIKPNLMSRIVWIGKGSEHLRRQTSVTASPSHSCLTFRKFVSAAN